MHFNSSLSSQVPLVGFSFAQVAKLLRLCDVKTRGLCSTTDAIGHNLGCVTTVPTSSFLLGDRTWIGRSGVKIKSTC